jgi:hypothetical protein
MAKGQKTGGKDFPKGVSGNPNGRPPVPADIREARGLSQTEFERIATELLERTKEELNTILKDPKTPAKVVLIARIIRSGMWSGDTKRLDFLMNRLAGRPKTQRGQQEEAQKSIRIIVEDYPDE